MGNHDPYSDFCRIPATRDQVFEHFDGGMYHGHDRLLHASEQRPVIGVQFRGNVLG
ncbi:MAG TPA: hypothetical protein PKY77_19605 [Phycisphaerae bacterium]|nr:hypothetical protein [Phycisphaerae bacterium]HRY71466.1 hypothetical protein [Phycisphaerae bacterium]HSA30021.1 hypothetical protein [Phycisphaerae bacterium]